jgi:hypothetical protein
MAKKFTEVEKGTFQKVGREYDYVVEVGEEFNGKKDMRVRIIEERPVIKKIRTRYDPEITMYGDKNASMELVLGYNMKDIKNTLRNLLFTLLGPFYFAGMIILMINMDKIPKSFFPHGLPWILLPVLLVLIAIFFKYYYKFNMMMLAEYLKARDLKKILDKEGYRE